MKTITQIIPKLPPSVNGLGDYALNLARQLRQDAQIETHFLIGDSNWTGAYQIEGFSVSQVNSCSASSLLSQLSDNEQSSTILLHYVNYAYAKRGCPGWLIDGLQHWRIRKNGRRLLTMFHELYAFGPPWTSSFWLSLSQKGLAARLACLSDRIFTSLNSYAETLHKLSRGKQEDIPALPVFSNIGEPLQLKPLIKRQRRLVVFGGQSNRRRVYRDSWAELALAVQTLGVELIWDIGPSTDLTLSDVKGVPIVETGKLSEREISNILSNSRAGFLNYDTKRLGKSTIFAAYCAHGVLPVSPYGSAIMVDGIKAGKHYWVPNHQSIDDDNLKEIQLLADNAYSWYQTHNLSAQAKVFSDCLEESICQGK